MTIPMEFNSTDDIMISDRMMSLEDYEAAALQKLPKSIGDYIKGGAGREITLGANLVSMQHFFLKPKMLALTESPDCFTELQNTKVALPIGIAPTAYHRLAHPQGEVGTCLAARNANTIHILSCLSTTSLTTLSKTTAIDHVWLQMLTFKNRNVMGSMIQQAQALGCRAIVLTVDAPISGNRHRDRVNQFALPAHLRMALLQEHGLFSNDENPEPWQLESFFDRYVDPHFSWKDLKILTQSTNLPIILKGVLRLDDVKKAIDCGVKGIIISNHGGRQLDTAMPSLMALAEIAPVLKNDIPLYIDGGFRTGADVFKALALGAKAVFLGRPILWGLAAQGQQGVESILALLKNELEQTMHLCSASRIADIDSDMICRL